MKLAASFFVLLLVSGIYAVSAESIISIDLDTDTLTPGKIVELTGSVESSLAGKPVGIEVKDSEGNIILIRSIITDSDGDFTLKFKIPSSASGELEIITSVEIDGQPFSESVSVTIDEPEPEAEPVPEAEPEAEPKAEPEPEVKSEASQTADGCGEGTVLVDGVCQLTPQESSGGCGAGTVMVNGVCQLAKTSGTSMSIEPMYIVIAAVAVGGGAVGALFALKRGSGTPKPAREELEEYESRYVARKPAEKRETSAFCNNCGNKLKPTAKFCGKCGTPHS